VNRQTTIMDVKFINSTGTAGVHAFNGALNYAVAHGAKVANVSWTVSVFVQSMYNTVAAARAKGTILVAAAGNSGGNTDSSPIYPADLNLDNVVSVAATDNTDNLAGFSSYGPSSVDLGAPGLGILSDSPGGGTITRSGTSMAAPHVAGAIALVWGQHPDWSYSQVISRILSTVDKLPS